MHSGNGDRKTVMKRSCVYKLDPFIDERGLMRVGGRLRESNLHFTDIPPLLLSKDSCITRFSNGAITRRLVLEEDLTSMKLGAMDFGSFDTTQLLGA